MDGLCGRMRELGVGQAAWPGRDKAGSMAPRRRRPNERGQKTSGLKAWSTKEKGELVPRDRRKSGEG